MNIKKANNFFSTVKFKVMLNYDAGRRIVPFMPFTAC